MARKRQARRTTTADEEPSLQPSPAFQHRPKKTVVRHELPDITKGVVPVLRKKPIVIRDEPRTRAPAPKRASAPSAPTPKRRSSSPPARPRGILEQVLPAERDWTPPETLRRTLAPPPPPAPLREPRELRRPAPPASAPAEPPAEYHEHRKRGLTLTGLFGTSLAIVTLVALVLFYLLPWVVAAPGNAVGPTPARDLPEGTLREGDIAVAAAHLTSQVEVPLLAWVGSLLLGAALPILDELPLRRADRHRAGQTAILTLLVFLQFLLALASLRWLGLYLTSLLDAGPTPLTLHAYPYLQLVLGGATFAATITFWRRKLRHTRVQSPRGPTPDRDLDTATSTAILLTLALLLLPLAPLAVEDTPTGRAYLGSGDLDAIQPDDPASLQAAAQDHHYANALLWLTFLLAWTASAIAFLGRSRPTPLYHNLFVILHAVLALPLLGAALFELLLILDLVGRPDVAPSLPIIIPAAVLAVGVVYVRWIRRSLMPFVRHMTATLDE